MSDLDRFDEMWNAGATGVTIQHELGISRKTIPALAKRRGLAPRASKYLTPAEQSAIIREHHRGLTPAIIGKLLGRDMTAVRKHIESTGRIPNKGKSGRPSGSSHARSEAQTTATMAEPVLTSCGHCGDWHTGTLAESSMWFRLHRCGKPERAELGRPAPPNPGNRMPVKQSMRISPRRQATGSI